MNSLGIWEVVYSSEESRDCSCYNEYGIRCQRFGKKSASARPSPFSGRSFTLTSALFCHHQSPSSLFLSRSHPPSPEHSLLKLWTTFGSDRRKRTRLATDGHNFDAVTSLALNYTFHLFFFSLYISPLMKRAPHRKSRAGCAQCKKIHIKVGDTTHLP